MDEAWVGEEAISKNLKCSWKMVGPLCIVNHRSCGEGGKKRELRSHYEGSKIPKLNEAAGMYPEGWWFSLSFLHI